MKMKRTKTVQFAYEDFVHQCKVLILGSNSWNAVFYIENEHVKGIQSQNLFELIIKPHTIQLFRRLYRGYFVACTATIKWVLAAEPNSNRAFGIFISFLILNLFGSFLALLPCRVVGPTVILLTEYSPTTYSIQHSFLYEPVVHRYTFKSLTHYCVFNRSIVVL